MRTPYEAETDTYVEEPRAACVGLWPLFESEDLSDRRAAASLCAGCEVAACEFRRGDTVTPPTSTFANCGTVAGADKHRRRREKPCDPCREAVNAAARDLRRRKAEQKAKEAAADAA